MTLLGAISWISYSGSQPSLVNIADEGRYVQQPYYVGKSLDRKAEGQSPNWSPWAWNPIQVGNAFSNRAKILDYKQSKDSLYVKCIPMQWDMNNHPAEAEMEQWILGQIQRSIRKLDGYPFISSYNLFKYWQIKNLVNQVNCRKV